VPVASCYQFDERREIHKHDKQQLLSVQYNVNEILKKDGASDISDGQRIHQ
jgi:hypothetical protein